MPIKKAHSSIRKKRFHPTKTANPAQVGKAPSPSSITVGEGSYTWDSRMERVNIIRERLPYEAIEVLSKRAGLSVKQILNLLDIPQTTYNKKKRDKELLSSRDSEIVLVLIELLDFGLQVFNDEAEKFHRWLKKPNISLGGNSPESFFDSLTGIQEVKNSLNRLEYGNLA